MAFAAELLLPLPCDQTNETPARCLDNILRQSWASSRPDIGRSCQTDQLIDKWVVSDIQRRVSWHVYGAGVVEVRVVTELIRSMPMGPQNVCGVSVQSRSSVLL